MKNFTRYALLSAVIATLATLAITGEVPMRSGQDDGTITTPAVHDTYQYRAEDCPHEVAVLHDLNLDWWQTSKITHVDFAANVIAIAAIGQTCGIRLDAIDPDRLSSVENPFRPLSGGGCRWTPNDGFMGDCRFPMITSAGDDDDDDDDFSRSVEDQLRRIKAPVIVDDGAPFKPESGQ